MQSDSPTKELIQPPKRSYRKHCTKTFAVLAISIWISTLISVSYFCFENEMTLFGSTVVKNLHQVLDFDGDGESLLSLIFHSDFFETKLVTEIPYNTRKISNIKPTKQSKHGKISAKQPEKSKGKQIQKPEVIKEIKITTESSNGDYIPSIPTTKPNVTPENIKIKQKDEQIKPTIKPTPQPPKSKTDQNKIAEPLEIIKNENNSTQLLTSFEQATRSQEQQNQVLTPSLLKDAEEKRDEIKETLNPVADERKYMKITAKPIQNSEEKSNEANKETENYFPNEKVSDVIIVHEASENILEPEYKETSEEKLVAEKPIESEKVAVKVEDGLKEKLQINSQDMESKQSTTVEIYNPGEIRSVGENSLCIDAPASDQSAVTTFYCHGQLGNQRWYYTNLGELRRDDLCLDYSGQDFLLMYMCHNSEGNQKWIYNPEKQTLFHPNSNLCLTLIDQTQLGMRTCSEEISQKWIWKP